MPVHSRVPLFVVVFLWCAFLAALWVDALPGGNPARGAVWIGLVIVSLRVVFRRFV
jgi:hypothetical protein